MNSPADSSPPTKSRLLAWLDEMARWSTSPPPLPKKAPTPTGMPENTRKAEEDEYRERFRRAVADGPAILNWRNSRDEFGINPEEVLDLASDWLHVDFDPSSESISIAGKRFATVRFGGSGRVTLTNCLIGHAHLMGSSNVTLRGCWIEELTINHIAPLDMAGGGVLGFELRGEGRRVATRIGKDVSFPATADPIRFPDSQPFKNLRHALMEAGNSRAAGVVWRAELKFAQNSEDGWLDRQLSRFYAWLSDYGTSRHRPLLIALGCFVASSGLAANPGATVSGAELPSWAAHAWQASLSADDAWTRMARGAIHGFATVFNPLGILGGAKPLVYVTSRPLAVITGFIGAVGTLSLAMFVVSVRRRFRLEG